MVAADSIDWPWATGKAVVRITWQESDGCHKLYQGKPHCLLKTLMMTE